MEMTIEVVSILLDDSDLENVCCSACTGNLITSGDEVVGMEHFDWPLPPKESCEHKFLAKSAWGRRLRSD
jgi:hypothetical protein